MNDDEIELTTQKLKWLRLPGMAEQLRPLLAKAAKENLTVLQAVDRLCDEEKASRLRNAVKRRVQDAKFPEINTVDAFDFDFCPVRKKLRARYLALHDLAFIERGVNPLFIGLPGTGKTFLARALISDNYFCRLTTTTSAGPGRPDGLRSSPPGRAAADGDGWAGQAAEAEAHGRKNAAGGGGRGRDERADGSGVAVRRAPLADEAAADVAYPA